MASLWEQLTSNNKLDRDRGNQQLELDLKINKDLGKDIWRIGQSTQRKSNLVKMLSREDPK